jgi:adenine-specific DNA-methyltransferase
MEKLDLTTPNFTDENIQKISELFPNCVTEDADGKSIDFDALKQELSSNIIEGSKERYQLNWPGKAESLVTANTPINKTLRPNREESKDFDNTENLYIEGDNLEVLKLLQETYLGKIKMIYIDPPYNTGKDFVYKDNFTQDKAEYDEESGNVDEEGGRLVSNPDSNGRYHSDWLSMMYPRLKLARNLLKDDGVIFISIDDGEVHNLRKMCDEVFGEKSFVSELVWKSRQNKDNRNATGVSVDHEHVVVYCKDSGFRSIRGAERNLKQYTNPDNDCRGQWASGNMVGLLPQDQRPNCHYDLVNPATGINYGKPNMGWRYDSNTMDRLIAENRILWPSDPSGRPRRKKFLSELSDEYTGFSSIVGKDIYTRHGTAELDDVFNEKYFEFPKPSALIKIFVEQASGKDGNVLDLFSGSATTAHAVMQLNAKDSGYRKFIMVQIPEATDEKSEAHKAGYKTIAEIGKERIRRAGEKIKADNADKEGVDDLDIGFRVLKVDSSNMKDVYFSPDNTSQDDILELASNIKDDRSDEDLLFMVLLDWGIDLSIKVERREIVGKTVYFADDNFLAACFEENLDEDFVKALVVQQPLKVVLRDSGFASSSVKINVEQIFKQADIEVKVI